MDKARFTTGLVLLILMALLIQWPQATAITPQNQTISITDTHDDLFITETGIGIDSQLCHILDPTMDIRSFLVFRELEINYWEPLENATLRFRTTAILDFDNESSVTVYGMKYSDLQLEGILNPSWVLSVPLTSAYVSVNTSQFYGQAWHEVNVTNIVEELIRSYNWDGDGASGTETGDSIGFVILGVEGYDTRWFIDYLYGSSSLAPQLVIHWNHIPPPPSGYGDAVFNETYRGYHIWKLIDSRWMNYTNWVEVDASAKIDVYNSSYVNLGDQFQASVIANLHNNSRGPYSTGGWKFGLMISLLSDSEAVSRGPIAFFHALGEPDYQIGMLDYKAANEYSLGFGISDYDDDTNGRFYFCLWFNDDGNSYVQYSASYYLVNATRWYWVDLQYDTINRNYFVDIYNDYEMTDLEISLNVTDYLHIEAITYEHEFSVLGQHNPAYSAYFEGALNSTLGTDSWIVTDENGTIVVTDLPDYGDTLIWIDDILGADPEDPDPPGEEWTEGPGGETGAFTRFRMRLWFLLIGFGCLFGPILFFAWRRPSGYYIICGAIVMLIGIGMLLSIGQV